MSQFLLNSGMQDVRATNEVSDILNNFSTDYIMNLMQDVIAKRFEMTGGTVNAVMALEGSFKQMETQFPDDMTNIMSVRNQTYQEIIDYLCQSYELTLNPMTEDSDKYAVAYYLYDFFAARFIPYVIQFFTNFIISEKNMLYDVCQLEVLKKNKDSSTNYNKKSYNDSRLAIINANLNMVIDAVSHLDLTLHDIFRHVFNKNFQMREAYINIVTNSDTFYNNHYIRTLNELKPAIVTEVRLNIHQFCIEEDSLTE